MRIPLTWLKEFVKIELPSQEIAKLLTQIGLEVDGIEYISPSFDGVVIGKVVEATRHPDADKLCVATVNDGIENYQVVCGAPNCRAGIKTAFAKIGAKLRGADGKEFKIKKTKLRGVESFGMLCADDELGLGSSGRGIMEFADQLKEGSDIASLYQETVFEISLTPNLSHCTSVMGVARELSAALGLPFQLISIPLQEGTSSVDDLITVSVADPANCPRYMARVIMNVKVQPSPEWLQRRLQASGIRPINNIVDITNYVLLEQGHPLHAFDLDLLDDKNIIVKSAIEGDLFKTLDGKERILKSEDLVICDSSKVIALAGVMGGGNSEVSEQTKNVILESAYFNPSCIRKTSKRLGLSSDASKRFERGTDPNQLAYSLDRACKLMQELAQGDVAAQAIDISAEAFLPKTLKCRLERINQILGVRLSLGEVESIFQNLGFGCHPLHNEFFVTVPTYRVDINEEIDLIEEVARFYGYDKIPVCQPKYTTSQLEHSPMFLFERELRDRLIALGLQELLTCDLIGPSLLKVVQNEKALPVNFIKIMNPTSIEQSMLRTSLLPGLLQVVKYNADHQNHQIQGFEIGRIHFIQEEKFLEQTVAGVILTGKKAPHEWSQAVEDVDFYDLKGLIENLLDELNIKNVTFQMKNLDTLHSGRQASIFADALEVGSFGEVHPQIVRRLDVNQRIYFAELNLHDLMQVRHKTPRMQPLPVFPSSDRDWTITVSEDVKVGDILASFEKIPSKILENVFLLDVYRSEKLGRDLKNLTFRFIYRDKEKTIAQEKVDEEHAKITMESINLIKK